MNGNEVRLITKSNTDGAVSNEVIITPTTAAIDTKPSTSASIQVTSNADKNLLKVISEGDLKKTTLPLNKEPSLIRVLPLAKLTTPTEKNSVTITAKTKSTPTDVTKMTAAYQKFLHDASTSGTSATGSKKWDTCAAQISSNLAKILANDGTKASTSKSPALKVSVMPNTVGPSLLRIGNTTVVSKASATTITRTTPAVAALPQAWPNTKEGALRTYERERMKRPQGSLQPMLSAKPLMLKPTPISQNSQVAVNSVNRMAGVKVATSSLLAKKPQLSVTKATTNKLPFRGRCSLPNTITTSKVPNTSHTGVDTVNRSSTGSAVQTVTLEDLMALVSKKDKSPKMMMKVKYPPRATQRSRSLHIRSFDAPGRDEASKITEEAFDSAMNSLMEDLTTAASKDQLPTRKSITSKADAKILPFAMASTSTSTSNSITTKPTLVADNKILRYKPSGTVNEPPSKQIKLALPFMNELNETMSWNRTSRVATMPNSVLSFERNEFGCIELHEKPTHVSTTNTSKPKKGKNLESLYCEHSNFDACFNSVLMRCGDDFWLNQTTPIEYHSNEFKEVIRACIQKHRRKCELVSLCDIQEAMAASKHFRQVTLSKAPKFDWNAYLNYWNAKKVTQLSTAPSKLFFNPLPVKSNPFVVGQKLEAIDPRACSLFCVCTVTGVRGFRIKLHFDGFHSAYDFWTNADSTQIFPANWCNRTGRELQAPPGYSQKFKWDEYLSKTNSFAAPRSSFALLNESTSRNPFKISMKLEAEDIKHSRKLYAATVGDVIDNRVLVTLDGLDAQSNYWADVDSPYLHPVNWHAENGYSIQAPAGWGTRFDWNNYLRSKRAQAVAKDKFCSRNPISFKVNMVLEVVDPCDPSVIRPARITMVDEYQIKVGFLEWPQRFEFWLDDDSPNIHPAGWCRISSHPLIAPQYGDTPMKIRSTCGFVHCSGIGNALRPDQFTHRTAEECPYSPSNWEATRTATLPNRLGSSAIKSTRLPVVESQTQSEQPLLLRKEGIKVNAITAASLKTLLNPAELKTMSATDVQLYRRLQVSTRHVISKMAHLAKVHDKWLDKVQPCQIQTASTNPLNWSMEEVANFVAQLPNSTDLARVFVDHEIDGLAFLALRQNDMTNYMGLSLGAAIKVFNRIVWLRGECNAKYIKYEV